MKNIPIGLTAAVVKDYGSTSPGGGGGSSSKNNDSSGGGDFLLTEFYLTRVRPEEQHTLASVHPNHQHALR